MVFAEETIPSEAIEMQTPLTMADAVNLALENNPSIQSYFFNTDIYKSRIGQTRSAYLPQIDIETSYSRLNSSTTNDYFDNDQNNIFTGITLNQLIYDFGKTPTNIKISKLNYDASNEDLKNTIRDVVFNVKKNYYLVLLKQQTKKVFEDSIDLYQNQYTQAKGLYDNGFKAKIDVITAEVNLNNAKLDLITASNDLEATLEYFNNAIGLPGYDDYTLAGQLQYIEYSPDFDELINEAYKNRPDLKSVNISKVSAEKTKKYAQKEYFPEISARTSFGARGDDSLDPSWSVGVVMSIPVFNGLLTHSKVKEAKATILKREADIKTIEQNIYLEIKEIYLDFDKAKKRIPLTELVVKQAQERLDIASKRYKLGFSNIIEVKDAEINLVKAKLSYLENLYDYNLAIVNLEKASGKDIPALSSGF